jgi:eukaryotic-like serine/threonine-protein kinase
MGDSDTEHKQQATARIGTVLREKWRLDALLGLGGMAAVYAATHRNGKHAAIKVLHPQAALVPDVKARFLREGYLANKVGHSGAVSILDDDVDVDGTVFLVMELLDGETLDARWTREKLLPWQQAFVIADKVLDVLIAAHKKDIVHRDLKPGNVFICTDGTIKILDFGIARLQTITQSIRDTGGHISLGTPGFMPQEQARGQWAKVDAQSDLWAIGATMFAVIAGRYVHEAATINEQLLAAMTEPAPPIRTIIADLPPDVADLIDRSLSFEKEKRWPDGPALQQALREVYESQVGQPISAATIITAPSPLRLRSVQPDAPTVAASDVDSLRFSSARSVSSRRQSTAKPTDARARRPWPLLIAGAGAMVLIGGWFATRPRAVQGSTSPALETPLKPVERAQPVTTPSPPLAPSPTPVVVDLASAARTADTEVTPPASAPGSKTALRSPAKAKRATPPASAAASAKVSAPPSADNAAAASSAAPPPTVDIFTRRK